MVQLIIDRSTQKNKDKSIAGKNYTNVFLLYKN